MTDMFLCWEIDLICILNIVKDITYDYVKYTSKTTIQSLKVQMSCCKTHRIGFLQFGYYPKS